MTSPLRIAFDVACPAEHAFTMWTSRIGTWWPPDHTVTGDRDQIGSVEVAGSALIVAEGRYRISAGLFETVRDTSAVASQLAAVGQTLIAQDRLEAALDELRGDRKSVV